MVLTPDSRVGVLDAHSDHLAAEDRDPRSEHCALIAFAISNGQRIADADKWGNSMRFRRYGMKCDEWRHEERAQRQEADFSANCHLGCDPSLRACRDDPGSWAWLYQGACDDESSYR